MLQHLASSVTLFLCFFHSLSLCSTFPFLLLSVLLGYLSEASVLVEDWMVWVISDTAARERASRYFLTLSSHAPSLGLFVLVCNRFPHFCLLSLAALSQRHVVDRDLIPSQNRLCSCPSIKVFDKVRLDFHQRLLWPNGAPHCFIPSGKKRWIVGAPARETEEKRDNVFDGWALDTGIETLK